MRGLAPIQRQDMDGERTYFGALTYLPHTWSLQNFKCMEFKSPFVVVPSSRQIEGVALMFVGVACPSFFLIFP